jgi:excisionase family DNA binding protein
MDDFSNDRWVSSKDIALYLDITKDTLHKWIKNKSIPCHRVGRLWKFKISEVDNWVKSGSAANNYKIFGDEKNE